MNETQYTKKTSLNMIDDPTSWTPLSLNPLGAIESFASSPIHQMEISGTANPSGVSLLIGHYVGKHLNSTPQLVVCADDNQASELESSFRFSNPELKIRVLPGFDVSPYSNLYPNERKIAERLGWLYHLTQNRPGDVFIAPIMNLLQRTLPFELFHQNITRLRSNDTVPNDLHDFFQRLGYSSVPLVEDIGTYSLRGGILDVFSPAHDQPIRLELFGDIIDTMKFFSVSDQRSLDATAELVILPRREILFTDENQQRASIEFKKSLAQREFDAQEAQQISRSLAKGQYFHGIEYLIDAFYSSKQTPLDYLGDSVYAWYVDPVNIARKFDDAIDSLKKEFENSDGLVIRPRLNEVFLNYDQLQLPEGSKKISFSRVHIEDELTDHTKDFSWSLSELKEFDTPKPPDEKQKYSIEKIQLWKQQGWCVLIASATKSATERLMLLLEKAGLEYKLVSNNDFDFNNWVQSQQRNENLVHIIPRRFEGHLKLNDEKIVFLNDYAVFGKKAARKPAKNTGTLQERTSALSFGDLHEGDFIVHKLHGVGIYRGLISMPVNGLDSEFVHLEYKGKDKLYVPIYRIGQIQKYSGPTSPKLLDKLGGTSWAKTQTKVRAHLRDIANDLLMLYAQRAQFEKPPFSPPDSEYLAFEASFPYQETDDQLKAINDVIGDMCSSKPMDRLVCGDVGFGKTEVAMRAAFKAIQDRKQVAVIAPTTVLTFQHLQTFRKRFKGWPVNIQALNRFVTKTEQKKTVGELKEGKVDIVIGTHRLFSKDIQFQDLGLLIIDEEQKFGVKHKERIRKIKNGVDTLTLSATPIPRTLNMSLVGVRDLSLINTPPVDRLPTRTFVTKFNKETIRKAVLDEVERGGQVFFLHNRVNSIYALHEELKGILPGIRMAVGHGQMDESELEKVMLQFFNHELDVLICTTIIESGMDIPRANTMFIDNAQQLGLSQLYQLRGRVGRSKTRAYCYLMIPKNRKIDDIAQERLKVIQENTALGSGMQIAHYDLELRGAGDILGEDQSGNINAVGYELYLELLEEQVSILKGEPLKNDFDPELNLKVKALIPDEYISDIRIRLSYYKYLSQIRHEEDLDRIEEELRDQFGSPPEPVLNLMGLMLIRALCLKLKIKDLSQGKVGLSLMFTEDTPLKVDKVLKLTQRADKKYSLTPDNRLIVRMKDVSWPRVYDELNFLLK
ncbi:MAG: transcription-repair coupling factor [Bdellovibrionales bacterium]